MRPAGGPGIPVVPSLALQLRQGNKTKESARQRRSLRSGTKVSLSEGETWVAFQRGIFEELQQDNEEGSIDFSCPFRFLPPVGSANPTPRSTSTSLPFILSPVSVGSNGC